MTATSLGLVYLIWKWQCHGAPQVVIRMMTVSYWNSPISRRVHAPFVFCGQHGRRMTDCGHTDVRFSSSPYPPCYPHYYPHLVLTIKVRVFSNRCINLIKIAPFSSGNEQIWITFVLVYFVVKMVTWCLSHGHLSRQGWLEQPSTESLLSLLISRISVMAVLSRDLPLTRQVPMVWAHKYRV